MKRQFLYSALILALLIGCAAHWPYPVRVLSVRDGVLRGPSPDQDLPLSVCDPDETSQAKCYVHFRDEYMALRKERNDLIERLKACEGME